MRQPWARGRNAFGVWTEPETKLLALLGDGFQVRRSERFFLVHDAAEPMVDPLSDRLQSTYDAVVDFCSTHRLETQSPSARLQVVFFDQPSALEKFRRLTGIRLPGGVGGYDPNTNMAAFYNLRNHPEVKQITEAEVETFNRLVLQHEIAHQVLFNFGVHVRGAKNPAWLVEGLACQFEVPQADLNRQGRGVNALRLADFKQALGLPVDAHSVTDEPASWPAISKLARQWRSAVEGGKVVELEELIGNDGALDPTHEHAAFRYAQSWALVYYLRSEHAVAFSKYLRRLAQRRPGDDVPRTSELNDFEAAFGRLDRALTLHWLQFILALPAKAQVQGP